MKRTSAELKRIARENLQGRYGLAIGVSIVAGLITSVVLSPFSFIYQLNPTNTNQIIYMIANIIISLVSIVLSAGLLRIHLKLARKENPVFSDLFYYFTHRPDRFIVAGFAIMLLSLACMLPAIICSVAGVFVESILLLILAILFIIAGAIGSIIISLYFGLTLILLADDNSMSAIEALRTSKELMAHNKGRLFYIQLSFIGWELLCMLSCFIGYLWLAPYMNQVTVEFYRDVKGELDAPPSDDTFYENDSIRYSAFTNY